MHLTARVLWDQGDVVGSLQDHSGYVEMDRVLGIVVGCHVGIAALYVGLVIRIAKDDFDRTPHVAARNKVFVPIALAERR
jgi:hypothetical protein